MKRGRDENGSTEATSAVQFELIHGLTSARCDAHANAMYAAHARLASSNPQNKDGVDLAALLTNTAHPWLAGPERVFAALMAGRARPLPSPSEDGAEEGGSGGSRVAWRAPPVIRTVQLVASDGEVLICAGDSGLSDGAAGPAVSLSVPPAVGERVFPGDVVLATTSPSGDVSTVLCGIDASVFDDAETWRDAVGSNVVAATRWVGALCAQPPGLPQLAFMESCRLGTSSGGDAEVDSDGWTRVLQLPLLLQVRRPLLAALDRGTVEGLHRTILSLLATMLSVLRHSEAVMSLPDLHRGLVYVLVSSPLYVEGMSSTLQRAAEVLGATAWQKAMAAIAAGVSLAWAHLCDRPTPDAGASQSAMAASALGGFELVLHRLSGAWLGYERKVQEMRRHGQQQVPEQLQREERVHALLSELAAARTFEPVARWLRQRAGTDGDAAELAAGRTPLGRMDQPPALRQLEALAESSGAASAAGGSALRRTVVAEQLAVMGRTYTPYLGKDALRFVEAAATAAHSELFGPAARAACDVLLAHTGTATDADPTPAQRLRVVAAAHSPPRRGGFATYSLAEVRCIAAYGLPLDVEVSPPEEDEGVDGEEEEDEEEAGGDGRVSHGRALAMRAAQDYLDDCINRRHSGSCFAYVLVRIQGEPALFPLLLTRVSDRADAVGVVAHAMRDADLLSQFLRTSAALEEDGLPDAWLLTGYDPCDEPAAGEGDDDEDDLEDLPARLLPAGTPALAYLDLLGRLGLTRRELCGELNNSSSSSGGSGGALPASSMWLRYFATGEPPTQVGLTSLSAAASGIATGTGATGKDMTARVLREATDAAPALTPAQTEALYALASGAVTGGSSSGTPLSGLRLVEGAVGSGKTSTLCAAGAARGRVLAAARREHHASLGPMVRETSTRVRRCLTRAEAATGLADVLPGAVGEGEGVATAGLAEALAAAVEDELLEYTRLGRGAQVCTAPLLLRCGQPARWVGGEVGDSAVAALPAHARELVFAKAGTAASIAAVSQVLEEALARSQRAPLVRRLAGLLEELSECGDALTAFTLSGADASCVDVGLLPLVLAAREVHETVVAAAGTAATWPDYLRDTLWGAVTAREGEGGRHPPVGSTALSLSSTGAAAVEGGWVVAPSPPPTGPTGFAPVQMPATTHLPRLSPDQAAGWHAVCLQKQAEVVPLLLAHIHATVRRVFELYLDVVYGVAAVAQVSRYDLVTATDADLLHCDGFLPFLWRWRPSHLFMDDFAVLSDAALLALPPPNALSLSLSTEVPVFAERHLYRAPMALLRELRRQLQSTAALTTASLHEPQRCTRPEVCTALTEMCVGTGDGPFAGVVLRDPGDEEDDKVGADRDGGSGGDGGGLPPAVTEAATTRPRFPGFTSFSALELWTHAVPVAAATRADAAAAHFLCESLLRYRETAAASPDSVDVCFPFPAEAEDFARTLGAPRLRGRVTSSCVPFSGRGALALHRSPSGPDGCPESECAVVVLCLSALVPPPPPDGRERGEGGGRPRQPTSRGPASEGRAAQWRALLATSTAVSDGAASTFGERLQWWWWRAVRRAREGVIVVCSKEFALHVPMLRYLERYVGQLRCQLAPTRHLRYWLPPATACAVLALNCPEHHRCRRTATITALEEVGSGSVDGGAGGGAAAAGAEDAADKEDAEEAESERGSRVSGVRVTVRGAATCVSLCLKPFAHCEARAHACLRPCHIEFVTDAEAPGEDPERANADDEASAHAHCPYPCGTQLTCGHVCDRTCGEDCAACSFTGLTELPCGQRVVSGVRVGDAATERGVEYELVPHFQEARCGAPRRPCVEPVAARCPRCGTRSTVPCAQLTAHESRVAQALREAGRGATATSANGGGDAGGGGAVAVEPADFILSDGECPGCVAVYNRVATKFGYDALPAPTVVQRLCDEPPAAPSSADGGEGAEEDEADLCALRERAVLPRHALSAEAQAELRKAFAVAAKRAELLLMKEALEVSNGSAPATSETVVQRRRYAESRARQQRQLEERQEGLRAEMMGWAQRLRGEYTRQSDLASRLEAMVPQLISEAREEASRQQRYGF